MPRPLPSVDAGTLALFQRPLDVPFTPQVGSVGIVSERWAALSCPESEQALVFEDGRQSGRICADDAGARGLTVIDLFDDWAPFFLKEDEDLGEVGKQPYLDTFRALARGDFGSGPEWEQAKEDRYFELYGIPPTLSRLRARIDPAVNDQRHLCHEEVDDSSLSELSESLRQESYAQGGARKQRLAYLERMLEHQRQRRELETLDDLAEDNRYYARQVDRYRRLRTIVDAITAVQEHLVCEGLLAPRRAKPGIFDWRTAAAVGTFQRKHMLLADKAVGTQTREAFLLDSREHDFRAVLRILRERVVDATGLIEDGSAREDWGKVLGRYLDSPTFRVPTGHELPEDGAPDLISPATEAAARALGWDSFEGVRAFFSEHLGDGEVELRVAVRLPPLPEYHGPDMELHAVIDRGDVWYEFPGYYFGGCVSKPVERHPSLTLYAVHGERKIALVRWHTTIGGWNKERLPSGWVALRYKNSEVGRRYWRDLVVAPAWFPPKSTPDSDLVRRTYRGLRLKYNVFGPSYRSAYGLVMLIHHQLVKRRGGEVFEDNGIRTHGSANVNSIIRGCSHGCHRLFNHQALRLAMFLLRHRRFVRHGPIQSFYTRRVVAGGKVMDLKLKSRGYRYELTPPVVVDVTKGRIRGRRRTPILSARPIH